MFNVGGMELVVIGLVALVVLGPDKLPGALRQLGTFIGELRQMSQGFQSDLRSAINEAEREAAQRASDAHAPATSQTPATGPDPGAARAVAQAELEAIESAEPDDDA